MRWNPDTQAYEFTPEFLESVQRGEGTLVLDCLRDVQGRMDKIEERQDSIIKGHNSHTAMLNGLNETLQAILHHVQPKPEAVLWRALKPLKSKKRKKP